MGRVISRAIAMLRRGCGVLAMAAAAYLLGVVAFNVAARSVFDATGGALNAMIPGAIEQSSYALLVFVFAAIPASLPAGLVSVDLFVGAFPSLLRRLLTAFWWGVLVVVAGALTVLFAEEAAATLARGELTQDLGAPLWIFYAITAGECAALALISLFEAGRQIAGAPAETSTP